MDLIRAIQCVELSQLSYLDAGRARELALGRYRYEAFEHFSLRGGRDHLIVVEDEDARLVAVRGTDEMLDWLTNIKLWRRRTPIGRVHRGYHQVSQAFLPRIRELIGGAGEKPVLFTGHSMGGAVASLVAATLAFEDRVPIEGLYTFGQPQVGLSGFSEHFRRYCHFPYYRFVHGADAFAVWTLGAQGTPGTPCYFDLRGRLSFGRELTQMPRLGLKFHRLEHYRYFLRLNRLRLNALRESEDVTLVQPR